MTHTIQDPPKTIQSLQQMIRNAIREAASSGMSEREIVAMTQRLLHENQGGKRK